MKQLILLLVVGLVPGILNSSDDHVIAVGQFSSMTPGTPVSAWEPMTFNKIDAHTRYTLVEDDGRTVLRADSSASASGLVKKMSIAPNDYPLLTWSWKVSNIISNGDVTTKSGDDYAARIYVTFGEDAGQRSLFRRTKTAAIKMLFGKTPPTAALAYVWGNRSEVGAIHANPYTGRLQMIVVESGPLHRNHWRSAQRDIVKDFQRAFGSDPPLISGIAIMTDTDNTGESATAWYGDIMLHRRPAD